jgi:hypothetical protein
MLEVEVFPIMMIMVDSVSASAFVVATPRAVTDVCPDTELLS